MSNQQGLGRFRPKLISIAVASCFVTGTALANPNGHTVVHGNVTVKEVGNLLKIHNSPNAVINWRSFSIGANEITRFIQESRNSVVMNRVTGSGGTIERSVIDGALKSNGRVYLLNSSGVVFGAGSVVDVAGLVVSSLQLSDADFHAKRLRFTHGAGAGPIENYGNITTQRGGEVYLVGPAVTNSGVITSPNGNVVLAAGNHVELVNPGTPNLRVEITAPDNQAVNLGNIVAESGRIGIYAGLINNSGTIRADSAVAEGGRILLKAKQSVTLESSSVLDASGQGGGTIDVQASKKDGTVNVAGRLDASAPVNGDGGFIETSAADVNVASGTVITTSALNGKTGTWLVDPTDYRIGYGGDITGAALSSILQTSNVVKTSDQGATAGSGNVIVDEAVSWTSGNGLTLLARNDVIVNQSITSTGKTLNGNGDIKLYAGWNGGSTSNPVVVNGIESGSIVLKAPVRTAGNIFLVAGNQISQDGNGILGADGLLAKAGSGGVFLNSAINDVSRIAGRAGTSFNFENGRTLTVGEVDGVSGITVEGSSAFVNLQVSGNQVSHLNVNRDITASAAYGGAEIRLQASGSYGGDINVRNAAIRAMSDGSEGYVDLEGRTVRVENSTVRATGASYSTLGIYAYGPGGVEIRNSTLESQAGNSSAYLNVRSGVSGGNVLVDASTITAKGREAYINSYGGNVTVRNSAVTATGQTGADGGAGFIGIDALNHIDTGGSTLRATGSIAKPPIEANALVSEVPVGDTLVGLFSESGDITLGFLSSNGMVVVGANSGRIVDGNTGANVAAPAAFLVGYNGVGTISNPLETQVDSIFLAANSGQVGVINAGNLRLEALAFGGSDARIDTTGTFRLGAPISGSGNLALVGGNGMVIDQSIAVGGDLFLASGAGDMGIHGVSVSGHNVELVGNSIFVGSTTGTAPTSVTADHLVKATTATNFNVIGGANSSAYSVVRGEDVDLTVGGVVNVSAGGAYAQIESTSPTTIALTFPNRSAGGFFVNGSEGVIYDEATKSGFLAGGQPAVLGQSLKVTYGGISGVVQEITNGIANDMDKAGESPVDDQTVTLADTTTPEEKQEGKGLPVCK
jgi:filamentous hemagglutinin family protein